MAGLVMIGSTIAGPSGDFVIILDEPLKAGEYQLTIRSTTADGIATSSRQTAVVSIPSEKNGQVLALVNGPGEPSRLFTLPAANPQRPLGTGQPKGTAPPPVGSQGTALEGNLAVGVEAVEVDGHEIFLAGSAGPGQRVRARVDDKALGETTASDNGRFLIEAEGEIAIGNHTVVADLLDPHSEKVIATAAVPFERDSSDRFAAVAPPSAGAPSSETFRPVENGPLRQAETGGALPTTLPALRNDPDTVIIRKGDTLWRISQRVYGHGVRYSTIYLANASQIRDPNRIWPAQLFKVPRKTAQGERADMNAIGDQATTSSAE
jgi:nucleoid-associated protein YgaU